MAVNTVPEDQALHAGVNTQLENAGLPKATNPDDDSVFSDVVAIGGRVFEENAKVLRGEQQGNEVGTGATKSSRFSRWVLDRLRRKK